MQHVNTLLKKEDYLKGSSLLIPLRRLKIGVDLIAEFNWQMQLLGRDDHRPFFYLYHFSIENALLLLLSEI